MTSNGGDYDVALTTTSAGTKVVVFPKSLSLALVDRNYNRARVVVTEEGLLVIPYEGVAARRETQAATLPEWSS